jgi:mRNA interferase MazF
MASGSRNNGAAPFRGDIWDVNLDPTMGHEQAGARPALIVSVDLFNEGPAELVVAIPLTRTPRKIRWHVPVSPPEGGLSAESYVQCENVRSISKARLKRLRGRVSEATLQEIEDRLRILLGL